MGRVVQKSSPSRVVSPEEDKAEQATTDARVKASRATLYALLCVIVSFAVIIGLVTAIGWGYTHWPRTTYWIMCVAIAYGACTIFRVFRASFLERLQ